MNDLKNSSNGLLVLKLSKPTTAIGVIDELTEAITPIADKLGVEPLVLPVGVDVELKMGSEALLLRVCEALEEIAAQGRAPDVHVADTAPQGLNARPSSLNSRPVATHTAGCAEVSSQGTTPLQKGERVSLPSDRSGQIQGAIDEDYGIRSKGR